MAEINASHLIGSKLLKPFMHGFFIKSKIYRKLKAAVVEEAPPVEAAAQNRIVVKEPKKRKAVNQHYADLLKETTDPSKLALLTDSRFGKLWESKEFAI